MNAQGQLHPRLQHCELLDLFTELTFREKFRRTVRGLKAPRASGDHKYANLQILHLLSPISAVLVPLLFIVLLAMLAKAKPAAPRGYPVEIIDPVPLEKTDPIVIPVEPTPILPDLAGRDLSPSLSPPAPAAAPAPTTELNPSLADINAVALVPSPVVMRNFIGNRSPGARDAAIKEFEGSRHTEDAVLNALRWLKYEQQPDGSWPTVKPAMTGLALLAFLARAETPASEEFGETVEKAIQWLVQNQMPDGSFVGADEHNYSHPIATYALCEAYTLTRVPMLKEPAERAIAIVIGGQHPSGGWDYGCKQSERDDTSYMGWCAQAVKAARMAGLESAGIEGSLKNAVRGFQKNAAPQGGFGYTGPGASGLTGVGVLCMQLLGASRLPECRNGLVVLEDATFNWEGGGAFNANYYWYYITQAKFQAGGDTWTKWNRLFAPALVKNQTVIKGVYKDPAGELRDMGWWDMPKELSGATGGPVMNTALCALQLEVYYRYLPTYRKPSESDALEDSSVRNPDDISVDVSI